MSRITDPLGAVGLRRALSTPRISTRPIHQQPGYYQGTCVENANVDSTPPESASIPEPLTWGASAPADR